MSADQAKRIPAYDCFLRRSRSAASWRVARNTRQMEPELRPVEILLVEDEPASVRLVREALKCCGVALQLNVCTGRRAGLAILRGDAGLGRAIPPDLVLLDLHLPKMDGFAVLDQLKRDAALKCIPIVVLTTSSAGGRHSAMLCPWCKRLRGEAPRSLAADGRNQINRQLLVRRRGAAPGALRCQGHAHCNCRRDGLSGPRRRRSRAGSGAGTRRCVAGRGHGQDSAPATLDVSCRVVRYSYALGMLDVGTPSTHSVRRIRLAQH